ncbi:MAG: NADH:ubiquinone reductase (Na(+)-transporting) subunit C [Bacteroidales bacterium]|nr:NADH:ubiquinone reductase (Na(+)-transporting) subunit C [Bacteroidales bacterium]
MKDRYIFTYIIILVAIVAVLLSAAAMVLQPFQQANIDNEKMMNILKAADVQNVDKENVQKLFNEDCVKMLLVNAKGEVVEECTKDFTKFAAFTMNMKDELYKKDNGKDYVLPIIVINNGKENVNVIQLQGAGLWGPIWGYIGMTANFQNVVGVVFDHKSETPGLGAEITTPRFTEQFKGKTIFSDGEFVSIDVVKGGVANLSADLQKNSVDAISGGTITSNGVNNMIEKVLESYLPYIEKQ